MGVLYKLFVCLFLFRHYFCTPVIDLSSEADGLLKNHRIEDANDDMKKLAKGFVLEQYLKDEKISEKISEKDIRIYNLTEDLKKTEHEKGEINAAKINAESKYKRLVIPVRVRSYILFIEDRFGKNSSTSVSKEIRNLATKGKSFLQPILDRMFRWWNFFIDHKDDLYIRKLIVAVDKSFKAEYPHEKIGGGKYNKFLLEFFEALATGCEEVNDEIAHMTSGKGPKLERTDFFNKIIDTKLTLFYNTLIGQKV